MNSKQLSASGEYRKAARNLLTEVSRMMEEAGKISDIQQRHELYLQAMRKSDEAYNLLGKARQARQKNFNGKH